MTAPDNVFRSLPDTYVLFLGCSIPVRVPNYEIASRAIAGRLNLHFVDEPDFACCGFPLRNMDDAAAPLLAARNLALAERHGGNLCTLCNSCSSMLTEVSHRLMEDQDLLARTNARLAGVGLEYRGGVTVKHYGRVLHEHILAEEDMPLTSPGPPIDRGRLSSPKRGGSFCKVDLGSLRIAAHYGCHYLKPSEIYDGADDPENPHTLDDLIRLAGAQPVQYENKTHCCGGAVLAVDEQTALKITKTKLDSILESGADAIALMCPFCSIMYDSSQKKIEKEMEASYDLPVLFMPQLLGLAMGIAPKELGFQMNRVKAKKLLEKIGVQS